MTASKHLSALSAVESRIIENDENVLLRVERLSKAFGGQVVLNEVSLELNQGEVVLLRGENGSGKTTLLNILTGNLEPDAGTIQLSTNGAEERFHFARRWWERLNPFDHFTPERVSSERIGRTWQDIRLFPTQNLRDNIAVATPDQLGENPVWSVLRRSAVQKQEREIAATSESMLSELGLEGRETSSADRISLGQSKRVAIGRAVMGGVRILFLDEPLAGLDAAGIADVMNLLKKLAHNQRLTLVIVEHVVNIPRILELATTVWTLAGGKISVDPARKIRVEIERPTGDGIRPWMREWAGPEGDIVDQELLGEAILSRAILSNTKLSDTVLEISDLVVHRGNRLVVGEQKSDGSIQGLSFTLQRGELAVLEAPNGWGKTTLLEAIAGLLPITRGIIRLNGKTILDLPPWERAKLGMALLQADNSSYPSLTVQEALDLAHVLDVPQHIDPLLSRRMSDLSGGEKQIVATVCARKRKDSSLSLLDEPFSALDRFSLDLVRKQIIIRQTESVLVAIPFSREV
jgi:ABC-type branched-subunit amino acid transport system ATPase component